MCSSCNSLITGVLYLRNVSSLPAKMFMSNSLSCAASQYQLFCLNITVFPWSSGTYSSWCFWPTCPAVIFKICVGRNLQLASTDQYLPSCFLLSYFYFLTSCGWLVSLLKKNKPLMPFCSFRLYLIFPFKMLKTKVPIRHFVSWNQFVLCVWQEWSPKACLSVFLVWLHFWLNESVNENFCHLL